MGSGSHRSASSSSSSRPAKKITERKSIFSAQPDTGALANFVKPAAFKRILYISKLGAKIIMGANGERLKELIRQSCCSIRVLKSGSAMSEFHLSGDFEAADMMIQQILRSAGAMDAIKGRA